MSNIKGTIVNVKDFLGSAAVNIKISGASESVFELEEGRCYVIPDFQREIRWTPENLIELMNDIYHQQKFLGNLILTRNDNKRYAIIDGQQRTSLLRMLIRYVVATYGDELPAPPELCLIDNEAFTEYEKFQNNNFSYEGLSEEEEQNIKTGDQYRQADRYQLLWETIKRSGILSDSSKARSFITNLYRCEFNVILSEEDSTNYSIEYFLDVNLKGIKLDTEDIFKGYLFHLDTSDEVRQIWVDLKRNSQDFNVICNSGSRTKSDCYPLMKMIEHFLYCYLYDTEKYKDIVFGEDFCLKQEVQIDSTMHYVGEHILKVVNNNLYIRKMLRAVIGFLKIAIDVVSSESPSTYFKSMFVVLDPAKKVDHDDIAIFHNFIKMILLDRKVVVSKAFVIKYSVNILLKSGGKNKEEYKKMYAIQMYVTLFSIFENKKGIEPVAKILKSCNWYDEVYSAIKAYFSKNTITERKRGAEFKYSTNPDNEEQRYHSIMLAAVYNFFSFKEGKLGVKKGKTAALQSFLLDSDCFSVEHFIANKSGKCLVKYSDSDEHYEYEYPSEIKKYSSSIFNYIYIPKILNGELENKVLQGKIDIVGGKTFDCEYSNMVIKAAQSAFGSIPALHNGDDIANRTLMDKYYSYDFKQQYARFVSIILDKVAERFSIE